MSSLHPLLIKNIKIKDKKNLKATVVWIKKNTLTSYVIDSKVGAYVQISIQVR
jgi:hypothetical protein